MTDHLSDDDLVLHHYGDTPAADVPRVAAHLAACAGCRQAHDELRGVLALVDSAPPAEPRPGFERDLWARLEPQLDPAEQAIPWRAIFWPPQWALAGGVAALVLVAFLAGRMSNGTAPATPPAPLQAADLSQRVLHAAAGDHLDSAQMVLVEFVNADTGAPGGVSLEQARAADLVAANRLIRQSAARSGDAAMADVLEDIERMLLEIANAPADATSNELSALQARITAEDLIFRVRVVLAEMSEQNRAGREAGARLPRGVPTS